MAGYALRRVATAVPVLLGATLFVFVAVHALPGGADPRADGSSMWQSYLGWLGDLAGGELGRSAATRRPVADMLSEAVPNTMRLALGAVAVEAALGTAIGLLAATTRRRSLSAGITVLTTLLVAVPVIVVGTTLQYFLGVRWGLLPISGTNDGVRSWILPCVVLALPSLAFLGRVTHAAVDDTQRHGYVATALAKGLSPSRLLLRHRLRNAAPPIVTFVGLDFAALLGGALFVENIFNINGVGLLTTRAIAARDRQVIVGCTLLLVATFVLVNVVVDLITATIDPRTRDD